MQYIWDAPQLVEYNQDNGTHLQDHWISSQKEFCEPGQVFIGNRSSTEQWTGVLSTITQDVFFRFARGLGGVHFRAGSLIKPFDSKRSSRLRQIISLRTPLDCLQFHSLQTSWEMKRLLLSGCDSIIRLTVAIFCLVTDRLRYVMTDSIPDTINHQALERKIFLKKICG